MTAWLAMTDLIFKEREEFGECPRNGYKSLLVINTREKISLIST